MDDAEALELIDAHLDQQAITEDQAQALSVWLREHPEHADRAFHRIFLHAFLRQRLQLEPALPSTKLARSEWIALDAPSDGSGQPMPRVQPRWRKLAMALSLLAVAIGAACFAWFSSDAPPAGLWVYEGFDYPPTPLTGPLNASNPWPEEGGLEGLAGGLGWAGPWRETGEKVSVLIADVSQNIHRAGDMRQFGPLGYADSRGHVLKSTGIQLRSSARPVSSTVRPIAATAFPASLSDEQGVGRDGAVVWLSFLAQSFDGRGLGTFAYLQVGTDSAGLRIGKLASARSGQWSAAAVFDDAERNVESSGVSSGQAVLLVARITFRPGSEQADVWIDPLLDQEPATETAALRILLPNFRLQQLAINSRYTTDFDELRLGGTFRDITPTR